MQVNGRGQVALRVALMRGNERDPSDPWLFDLFRVVAHLVQATVGFAQSRSPTAVKFSPFRTNKVGRDGKTKSNANHASELP